MRVEKMAIEAPHTLSIGGPHTQRTGERAVLYRSTKKDWDVERGMKSWGLEELLVRPQ